MPRYTFMSTATRSTGKPGMYSVESVTVEAEGPEAGLVLAQLQFTDGASLFCWFEEPPEYRCNVCRAPWHEATGHYQSATMRWCGACTRSWIQILKGHMNRRWGGARFYDHATVPVGDTSAADAE